MLIRSLLLAIPLLLSACAGSFVSSSQTNTAAASMAKLQTVSRSAELGAFSTPRSFDIAAPYYADAIAGFRSIKPAEEGSGLGDRTEERAAIRQALDNCIESIQLTAKLHRTAGLTSNPDDFIALPTCESAIRTMGRSR
jgi:hypothetical protein